VPPANNVVNNTTPNQNRINAEARTAMSRPHFAYTQRAFWDGPNADYTTLTVLACLPFTGFIGLDHLYMRSPATALAKAVLNIFSLGLWYFYDVAQVLTERDRVKDIGYSMPIIGPTGLGAGIFPKTEAEVAQGPSPWRFIIYIVAALIPLPFGQDFFAAGDIPGGIAKLFTLGAPLLWLFGLIWGFYVIFRLFFQTEALITEGVPRFFPFTLFMSDFKCSKGILGPDRGCKEPDESHGFFGSVLNFLRGVPVLGKVVDPVVQTLNVAKQTAVAVGERVVPPVVAAAGAAVTTGAEVLNAVPKVAGEFEKQAAAFTDPAALAAKINQRGGGQVANQSLSVPSIILLIAGMVGSGVLFAKVKSAVHVDMLPDFLQTVRRSASDVPPSART
jgi:hypothetical protein